MLHFRFRQITIGLILFLFWTIPWASAEVLKWDLGVAGNVGQYSVDDPDGKTESASSYSVTPVVTFVFSNDWRLWTEIDYKQFELEYSQGKIGQDVKSISLDALLQRALNRAKTRFFLNGGVGLSQDSFKDRALVGEDGFIERDLPNRTEFNAALLLGGGLSFQTKKGSAGVNLLYQLPLSNGVEGFKLGFYWLFFGKDNTL
jgi:hypothetical protein